MEELWAKRRDLAIRLLENSAVLGTRTPEPRVATPRSPFAPGRFSQQKAEIVRLINRIESYGCLVKDIDLGLLDFPSIRDGKTIYLCWQAGEEAINHWHGTDEGYGDRRPI